MTNWYEQFIPNFADLVQTLYQIKRKRVKYVWISEAQKSYEKLKQELMKAPVLAIPVEDEKFELIYRIGEKVKNKC